MLRMFFERGQIWIRKPGYLGSGSEIKIRKVIKTPDGPWPEMVKVRDSWYWNRIDHYTKGYIITFFEPLDSKLLALIDRERLL
jgi:hypothetical protein